MWRGIMHISKEREFQGKRPSVKGVRHVWGIAHITTHSSIRPPQKQNNGVAGEMQLTPFRWPRAWESWGFCSRCGHAEQKKQMWAWQGRHFWAEPSVRADKSANQWRRGQRTQICAQPRVRPQSRWTQCPRQAQGWRPLARDWSVPGVLYVEDTVSGVKSWSKHEDRV